MHLTNGLLHHQVTNYPANGLGLGLGLVVRYITLAQQFDALLSVTLVNMFKRNRKLQQRSEYSKQR